ncbi:MAG: hypothetical protein KA236_10145 [Verrucomicrobia bacterium]|nr:hypothetical protein [Verrucomicrobiota bacterium]
MFDTLCRLITKAGDTPKPEKIGAQIDRAYAYVTAGGSEGNEANVMFRIPRAPTLPTVRVSFEPDTLHKIAGLVDVPDVFEFVRRKSAMTPGYLRSGDYLDVLYRVGERVLIFNDLESQGQIVWEKGVTPAHELPAGSPDGVWFLPNPVDGLYHPNPRQGGKPSRRSQESVTAFRYAVLESDEAPTDDWLKLLVQLPLPIESICESGGRSIHALLRVDAGTKAEWDAAIKPAKPLLTRLGADPGALSAVQLSRLPQADRGDRLQRVLYVNPGATTTPIKDLPGRSQLLDWVDWAELIIRADMPLHPDELKLCIQHLVKAGPSPRTAHAIRQLQLRGGGA